MWDKTPIFFFFREKQKLRHLIFCGDQRGGYDRKDCHWICRVSLTCVAKKKQKHFVCENIFCLNLLCIKNNNIELFLNPPFQDTIRDKWAEFIQKEQEWTPPTTALSLSGTSAAKWWLSTIRRWVQLKICCWTSLRNISTFLQNMKEYPDLLHFFYCSENNFLNRIRQSKKSIAYSSFIIWFMKWAKLCLG